MGKGLFDLSDASGQAAAVPADGGLCAGDTAVVGVNKPLDGSLSQQRHGTLDSAPEVADMPNTDHSTVAAPAQPSVLLEPVGNPPPVNLPPASHAAAVASSAGPAANPGSLAGRRRLTLRRARSKQPATSAQQPQ